MTKLDAGLMTPLPASDPGSAAVWGSKRINPRHQSCLCLTWSGYPSNDDDDEVEEMEVAEMKMLRFAMGVTRKDKIRNEYIRSTVKVERLGMKMREGRLRWYGHVMRRDQEYVGRKMMEMELPGKRKRGRPKKRFLDVVKEDIEEVGAKETDIEDRKMWRMMIRCGYP